MDLFKLYENCTLCPRNCQVNRNESLGICHMPSSLMVSRASLHMWEEPFISGLQGSGTVFFTGCNLHCVFCQNHEISGIKDINESAYKVLNAEKLSDVFLSLEQKNANNINLVTGVHYIPHIAKAIEIARQKGLSIPVLYNSSGYERKESLKLLDGLIDIYLPDFKYIKDSSASLYSKAGDYPSFAKNAIDEMFRQVGKVSIDDNTGLIKKGVVIRHLVLPGSTREAMSILDYLYTTYGNDIYISIMSQYTPFIDFLPDDSSYDNLRRKLTKREYNKVVDYALSIGIENAFIQDDKSVSESFVPNFKGEGLE